jgi:hypothetical protein
MLLLPAEFQPRTDWQWFLAQSSYLLAVFHILELLVLFIARWEGALALSIMRCIEPSIINLKFPAVAARAAATTIAGNESIDWQNLAAWHAYKTSTLWEPVQPVLYYILYREFQNE